jgi:hypothetical protein
LTHSDGFEGSSALSPEKDVVLADNRTLTKYTACLHVQCFTIHDEIQLKRLCVLLQQKLIFFKSHWLQFFQIMEVKGFWSWLTFLAL